MLSLYWETISVRRNQNFAFLDISYETEQETAFCHLKTPDAFGAGMRLLERWSKTLAKNQTSQTYAWLFAHLTNGNNVARERNKLTERSALSAPGSPPSLLDLYTSHPHILQHFYSDGSRGEQDASRLQTGLFSPSVLCYLSCHFLHIVFKFPFHFASITLVMENDF